MDGRGSWMNAKARLDVDGDASFLRPGAGLVVTLVALAPVVTVVTLLAFRSISTNKDAIIDEPAKQLVDTEEICTLFERKVSESRAFMLTGEERYVDSMLQARAELAELLSRLRRTAGPAEMQLLNALETIEQEDQLQRVHMINERRSGAGPEVLLRLDKDLQSKRSELDRVLHSFEGFKERQLAEARGQSQNHVFRMTVGVGSFAMLAFTLAALLAARLAAALARLKQSETRLQMLIVGVKDYAIFLLDPDGRVASWNWGAERIYGYRADEIIGQHFERFYLEEDRHQRLPDTALRIGAAEGRYEGAGWQTRKDGSLYWATTVLTALRDTAGRLRGFSILSKDITDRKRVEDELLDVNRTLQALIEASPVAVLAVDCSGTVNTWNPAAERLFGWKAAEVLGRSVTEVMVAPDDGEEPCDILRASTKGFVCEDRQTSRRRKDGSSVEVSIYTAPLHDATGALRGAMALLGDISERKRVEREREDAFRERDRLFVKAEEAARAREEVLSMASHDLRSPLSALQLQSRGLLLHARRESTAFGARMVSGLERMDRGVTRINNFIEALLDASRLEAGRLHLYVGDVDLVGVVKDVLERSKEQLDQAGYVVNLTACESVIGRWDAMRLEQMISNLLDNAMKYGKGNPIDVTVRGDVDHGVIVFRDHGIGINAEDRERIFEKATRATGTHHAQSFGFGLWIVRWIVDAFGGSIDVTGQPGQGATFTVVLPRRRPILLPASAADGQGRRAEAKELRIGGEPASTEGPIMAADARGPGSG